MPDFDPYAEFGSSVDALAGIPNLPPGAKPGPAVAKYALAVEQFGCPLWWELLPLILNRVHSCASWLRLRPVADLIGAVLVGQCRGFERQVQQAALVRLEEDARIILGDNEPESNKAVIGLLLAVISLDPKVTAEMTELQRLPVSRFAVQARILALDDAVGRHWPAARAAADRADMHVIGAMASLFEAGVTFTADALPATQRRLLRKLSQDVPLCIALASGASQDGVPLDAIDEAVERHLPRVIWSGFKKNGEPISDPEWDAVCSRVFGSKDFMGSIHPEAVHGGA